MTQKIQLSTLVNYQLPGFVTDTGNSMLPKFLEYYYEFLESEDEYNNLLETSLGILILKEQLMMF
jgi:hypothetical protein